MSGVKHLIDKHITEYERYYKSICYHYYNGRYLWEDLFQELYIGFIDCKPDTVLKFSNDGKLNYLGALILRNTFGKRGYHKKNKGSSTSNLFELSNICELVDRSLIDENSEFDEFINSIPFEKVEDIMNDLYKEDWFKHDVFIMAQKESLNSLSKRTTINRKYLTDTYRNAQRLLRTQLENI